MKGMLPVFHRLAWTLIDPGTTHSLVTPDFMCGIDMKPTKLSYDLEIRMPTGEHCLMINMVYKNCEFWIGERRLTVDSITLPIWGYYVIIGMDCLTRYHGQLNCRTKVVEFHIAGESILRLDMNGKLASSALILGIQTKKLLYKGAQVWEPWK